MILTLIVLGSSAFLSGGSPFDAPDGFEITQFADDELAHDIYAMAIDSRGRVVVSGRGYVKTLSDTDQDGVADQATIFSTLPKNGAQGLFFDGDALICTGDGALMRLSDTDADGVADGPPEIWAQLPQGEHGAHGIIRGADGWFYVVCGNSLAEGAKLATTTESPVKQPRSGVILRFSADGKESEIVAHGFRNPYDIAFNAHGHLFTVDSDGERDQHLPWYAPARLFDVAHGMHHGWLPSENPSRWNRPAVYFDNVPRLAEVGRGSPTGLVVYRHRQFPPLYRGGVFSCCWSLGRVYCFPLLSRDGSSYKTRPRVFLQTTGDVGFAPVDLAVAPTGDLFVAIGGRGTQGGVYRIRYSAGLVDSSSEFRDPLSQVLRADQPLSAWSRQRWMPVARELGPERFLETVLDQFAPLSDRIRAVEILNEVFDGVPATLITDPLSSFGPELTARIAWALSQKPTTPRVVKRLVQLTSERDPLVQRAAWRGLAVLPLAGQPASLRFPGLGENGVTPPVFPRDTRATAAMLLADAHWAAARDGHAEAGSRSQLSVNLQKGVLFSADVNSRLIRLRQIMHRHEDEIPDDVFDGALSAFRDASSTAHGLDAVRLMMLCLGDVVAETDDVGVPVGYAAASPDRVPRAAHERAVRELAVRFPTGHESYDLEIARLLGMLRARHPDLPARLASQWTQESRVTADIHYLMVMSQLPEPRTDEVVVRIASALARLHDKLAAGRMHPSRNWPDRVGETFDRLCRIDEGLAGVLIADARFGQPDHSLFASRMPELLRRAAARKMLARMDRTEDLQWSTEMVEIIAGLPPTEYLPVLRQQWNDFVVRDAIVSVLARDPQPEDRGRFIVALNSVQAGTIQRAAMALEMLEVVPSPETFLPVLRAMRHVCIQDEHEQIDEVHVALDRLLSSWSGNGNSTHIKKGGKPADLYISWSRWFASAYPRQSLQLERSKSTEVILLGDRLQKINWAGGDRDRGRQSFQRRSCHACHHGNRRLGPVLNGITDRFSRNALFEAIVDPSRDVAPTYQTTRLVTESGKVYHGLPVYQSPDATLLLTGAETTVRIAGEKILHTAPSRQSLMPKGLLRDAGDEELADLYAYLKTIKAK